jgi:hypothetical protein
MRPIWIKAALLLLAVWLVAGTAMWWSKANKPTPESLAAYVETLSVEGKSSAQREKEMEKIAKQLNKLTFEQRREVRMNRKLDRFFRQLTPDEQNRFLDLTLPEGFRQMMESLNKMPRDQRQRFVNRALKDMQDQEGAPPLPEQGQNAQRIVEQGLKSFYNEASAETKLDLAPLIEQFQRNIQSGMR